MLKDELVQECIKARNKLDINNEVDKRHLNHITKSANVS